MNACFQNFDNFLLFIASYYFTAYYALLRYDFFVCDSNFVAFRITFSTRLFGFLSILFQVIPKYVQHYPQYLILHLNFIVVKTSLLKEKVFLQLYWNYSVAVYVKL